MFKDIHELMLYSLSATNAQLKMHNNITLYIKSDVCITMDLPSPPLFYGHYTGAPALARTSIKFWNILLVQSFTAHMPLLTATSAFRLRRRHWRSQQC